MTLLHQATPMTADHQAKLEKTWSRMPQHVQELHRLVIGPTLAAMQDGLVELTRPTCSLS